MRAAPDSRCAPAPDQIPRLVDLGLEAGLAHPAGGQLVRRVLLRGVAPARAAADRVQLIQTLVDPSRVRHLLCAAVATFPPQSIAAPNSGASEASAKAA